MPWTRSFWVDTGGCEGLGLRVWSVILDIYNDYILHILHIFGGWFVVSTYPPKNPVSKHTIHRVNCGETSRGSVRFERLRYRFWSRFSTLPHCTNVSACKSIHGKGRLIHCKKIWWCLQRVDALGSKADLPHKSSHVANVDLGMRGMLQHMLMSTTCFSPPWRLKNIQNQHVWKKHLESTRCRPTKMVHLYPPPPSIFSTNGRSQYPYL